MPSMLMIVANWAHGITIGWAANGGIPWVWLIFFAGDPYQYIRNNAFWYKMLFIALAGINVIVYYTTGLYRRVDPVGAGEDVPVPAKVVAALSLFLWLGVIYWGRMMPFVGNSF